jgi:uncharacterized membrane protein
VPFPPPAAIADAVHQIGFVILLGSIFFLLFVLRPAARDLATGDERLMVYLRYYKHLFRWAWIALLLLWLSGTGKMLTLDIHNLPPQVGLMAGAGAVTTVLTLLAHFAFYHQMDEAIFEQHWPRAARRGSRVRRVMALNLLIGLMLIVAGVAAPLIPFLN